MLATVRCTAPLSSHLAVYLAGWSWYDGKGHPQSRVQTKASDTCFFADENVAVLDGVYPRTPSLYQVRTLIMSIIRSSAKPRLPQLQPLSAR